VWADDDWLLEQGVEPWSGLPTWYPGGARLLATGRIEAEGFTARPLADTALGAWEALRGDPAGQPPESYRPAGLDRATELELVAAWRARR
jgi:2'-hydroxyisoflavone reductase